MIKLNEKEKKELDKLHSLVDKRRKENALEDLAKLFQKWGKPRKEVKKAEDLIKDYHHLLESLKTQDPFVLVADALSDGTLKESEVSKGLFKRLEVVFLLMKN